MRWSILKNLSFFMLLSLKNSIAQSNEALVPSKFSCTSVSCKCSTMKFKDFLVIKDVPPKFVLVTYKGYLLTYRSNTVVQKTQSIIFGIY